MDPGYPRAQGANRQRLRVWHSSRRGRQFAVDRRGYRRCGSSN
jgi:hypothetical protein